MNEYKIKVSLERGLIINPDIHLVQNDYNSTTFDFEFDDDSYEQYTKVFQLQYPDGTIWKKEIRDNKVTLANFGEEGNPVSILVQTGKYYFDIAVYDNDSKLTTTEKVYFNVREEITGEDIELDDRLPVLDDLINTVNRNLNETDNLDIELKDNILTITKKDGTSYSENVKGEKGEKGDAGSIKFIIVNELPTEDIDESAIYMKPYTHGSGENETNTYEEFIYVNGVWELLGTAQVQVDLTDYIKNTDYATSDKGGVIKTYANYGTTIVNDGIMGCSTRNYNAYQDSSTYLFISKGTLENVITGKGLVSNTDYATNDKGGVIKSAQYNNFELDNEGRPYATALSYSNYLARSASGFISKHTLENVLNARFVTLTQAEYDALVENGTYTREDGTKLTYYEDTYYDIVEE